MAGITRLDRDRADARLVAECRRLLAAGIYPSVNELRKCRGVPRNGTTILAAARRRAIDAGLIAMRVDHRRAHPPVAPRPRPPGKVVATPDPRGFIKPRIAALDPPPSRKERAITPCWREIKAYRDARQALRTWLASRTEVPCPT